VLIAGIACGGAIVGFGMRGVLAGGIPQVRPLLYSGTLLANGQPVNDPGRSLTVNLWAGATPQVGEIPLCTTTVTTPVIDGQFRLPLGMGCKAAINAHPDSFAEVVDGTTSFGRSKIGAVPYAVEADHAVAADSAMSAANATHATSADTATNATSAGAANVVANSAFRVEKACDPVRTSGATDCICAANEVAISGGAFAGGSLAINASQQGLSYGDVLGARVWRLSCVDSGAVGGPMRVPCITPFAVCVRVQ
jgi:hypothetical protein